MELHIHPISTTSRPLMLFCAEAGIAAEQRVVDLMTGEHTREPFLRLNPSALVPVLTDGDFWLTESSAILKYLAEKAGSPAYPTELRARARVNEVMDWFNTNLYRNFAYDLVYPQIFPGHKRRGEEAQAATLEWGRERSRNWFRILDASLLSGDRRFLCGDAITVADYLGAGFVGVGEAIGCDFADYPRVQGWLGRMKALKHWPGVFGVFDGFAASLRGQTFVRL